MDLNSDNPISGKNEDKLDRAGFASSVAKRICSIPAGTAFTVGLYGKWGSGKTSLINMVIEDIEDQAKRQDTPCPAIIRFEPWNCTSALAAKSTSPTLP